MMTFTGDDPHWPHWNPFSKSIVEHNNSRNPYQANLKCAYEKVFWNRRSFDLSWLSLRDKKLITYSCKQVHELEQNFIRNESMACVKDAVLLSIILQECITGEETLNSKVHLTTCCHTARKHRLLVQQEDLWNSIKKRSGILLLQVHIEIKRNAFTGKTLTQGHDDIFGGILWQVNVQGLCIFN